MNARGGSPSHQLSSVIESLKRDAMPTKSIASSRLLASSSIARPLRLSGDTPKREAGRFLLNMVPQRRPAWPVGIVVEEVPQIGSHWPARQLVRRYSALIVSSFDFRRVRALARPFSIVLKEAGDVALRRSGVQSRCAADSLREHEAPPGDHSSPVHWPRG